MNNMWKWAFVSFIIANFLLAQSVHAEDYISKIHPYVALTQTYDDNINLTSNDKKADGTTTLLAGASFNNMNKAGGLSLDFNIGQNWYWSESEDNYLSAQGTLQAQYMTSEHIRLSLQEMFIRSNEPREQQYFVPSYITNAYMLSYQTTRSIYERNIVMPTIDYQFGKEDHIGLRYTNDTYVNQDPTIGKSQENSVSSYFSYWLDSENSISGEYGFTRGDFQNDPNFEGHAVTLRYTNRPYPNLNVFTEYVYQYMNFDPPSVDYDVNAPSVGITYDFSSQMKALFQVGYYWQKQQDEPTTNGLTFNASLTFLGNRTVYYLLLSGGYHEDYFTSQNLGFSRYYGIVASITHSPERRIHLGLSGNLQLADYQSSDRNDTMFGITGSVGYDILAWLTISAAVTHQEQHSSIDTDDYTDNKLTLSINAVF